MKKTKIEWCDATINPVVGCTFGCPYCYARKLNDRFGFIEDWNEPKFFPERLKQLECKTPKNVFMNSMSDIADWGHSTFKEVYQAMNENPQHNYLFLTKRPTLFSGYFDYCENDNIWFGISVTNHKEILRDVALRWLPVQKRFISFEPLHEEILISSHYWSYWDWFIIGAETGNQKDKIIPKKDWIDKIVEYAKIYNIPVFMKDSLIPIMGEENMLREFPEELKHEKRSI